MSSKIVSSDQIRDEFQQNYLANESSIKATLAENIFRITKWNLLKPKYSKIKKGHRFKCFEFKLFKSLLFESKTICGFSAVTVGNKLIFAFLNTRARDHSESCCR